METCDATAGCVAGADPCPGQDCDETTDECVDECVDVIYEAEDMYHSVGGTYPDGWNIWGNGYASFTHNFEAGGPAELLVRAAGSFAGGAWPNMTVTVNGTQVYQTTVYSSSWTDYTVTFNAPAGVAEVRVNFTNDYYNPPQDRNLYLDKVTVVCVENTGGLTASFDVFNDWGSGYCVFLDLTNNSNLPTVTWNAVVNTFDTSIYTAWNSTPTPTGTGQHPINPLSWNSVIASGTTDSSIGFCANRPAGSSTLPQIVSVTGVY